MIIKEILNRRAVREYKRKEVPEKYIIEIIKAGQFAPTAYDHRSIEFIIVKNQETKDKIFEIVGQEFVREAPVLIIPVIDSEKSVMPIQDLAVASENMFLQATALELGSVWKSIGWKDVRPKAEGKLKELLGIPAKYKAINMIPVGYPKDKPKPHTEADFDAKKIHEEKW
jgi:nitroreductase